MEAQRRLVRLVVYILLEKNGKILLGKRKNSFGDGYYSTPAGHIEHGESVLQCARRELLEETGIDVEESNFDFVGVRIIGSYEIDGVKSHEYVGFFMKPKNWEGEPKLMEPEKSEEWKWYPVDAFPEPMFPPVPMLLECLKTSTHFVD